MRDLRNITRLQLALIPVLVALMSWPPLPIHFSSQIVQASPKTTFKKPVDSAASKAAANGRIAFVSTPVGNYLPDIYTMNPDGSDRKQVTFDGRDVEPAWSPDGTQIAFTRMDSGSNYGSIFVMNADGSNQRQLTHAVFNARSDHNPSWSPDGTKIAFSNDLFPGGCLP